MSSVAVLQEGVPNIGADGAYWWFKPASKVTPEPVAVFVRWVRGAVRAVYGDQLVRVTEMDGRWCGPIPWPDCWGQCEHGVVDGNFCEPCNKEYKAAAASDGGGLAAED